MEKIRKSENAGKKVGQAAVFLAVFICCFCFVPQRAEAKTYKVLFVGNSKTCNYDIPEKFAGLAESMGKKVKVTSVTARGKDLSWLAQNRKKELRSGTYNYVVIQEYTSNMTNYSEYLKGAKAVVRLVRKNNPNVKVIVRNTWLKATSSSARIALANENTIRVAKKIGAYGISQDGPAFELCSKCYPNIPLYQDTKHQTRQGAYLSACCIYAAVFRESPEGSTYMGDLSSRKRVKKLQKIAAKVSFS